MTKKFSEVKAIVNPKERDAEIQKMASSPEAIGVYSPIEFKVKFQGEIVTVQKGWNQYSSLFAVWLLGKYGKGSDYGKCYHTVTENGKQVTKPIPELLDYDPNPKQAEIKVK